MQWRRDRPNARGVVYVGRGRGAWGRWGNPWAVEPSGDPHQPWAVIDRRDSSRRQWARFVNKADAIAQAVRLFRSDLRRGRLRFTANDVRRELRGRDLGCWCHEDSPWCHGNVLLEVANDGVPVR